MSIYLITGANRGIGRGLTTSLLLRAKTTILALVRDPSHETSESLKHLPKAEGSKAILIQYDASIPESAGKAIKELETQHQISKIDVTIANVGVAEWFGKGTDVTSESILAHINTNSVSSVMLFQAVEPLLRKSSHPKFVAISSEIGSTTNMFKAKRSGAMPYGMSKAALNYAMMNLSIEHPDMVVLILTPGRVMTDFGGQATRDRIPAAVSLEDSIAGLLKLVDNATKETSGKFFNWDGREIPW